MTHDDRNFEIMTKIFDRVSFSYEHDRKRCLKTDFTPEAAAALAKAKMERIGITLDDKPDFIRVVEEVMHSLSDAFILVKGRRFSRVHLPWA